MLGKNVRIPSDLEITFSFIKLINASIIEFWKLYDEKVRGLSSKLWAKWWNFTKK
jgi:hypothetical protein